MTRTESSNGRYVVAAAVGGVCGGLAALLATRELPKAVSQMKEHMQHMCEEHCACMPSTKEEETGETSTESSCN